MEDSGIGRPSTFAETVRKIKEREYVVKEERDNVDVARGLACTNIPVHHKIVM